MRKSETYIPTRGVFRLVGKWKDGEKFLICLGISKRELYDLIMDSLEEYTIRDIRRFEWIQYEQYYEARNGQGVWLYDGNYDMRQLLRVFSEREEAWTK